MSDLAWEALSDQAVAAAGVLYFVALLAYLVEWSSLRSLKRAPSRSARASEAGDVEGDVLIIRCTTRL